MSVFIKTMKDLFFIGQKHESEDRITVWWFRTVFGLCFFGILLTIIVGIIYFLSMCGIAIIEGAGA